MQSKRTTAYISLLLLVVLVLAGCAPRPGAGQNVSEAPANAAVVDLPSVVVELAADGSAKVAGLALADLAAMGVPAELPISPDTIKQLTDLGIQHIQLANLPNGLALYVNGRQMPSIGWTADQLAATAKSLMGGGGLADLLPIVTQLGLGVTLKLPVADGVTPVPLAVAGTDDAATQLKAAQEAFIAQVGSTPTILIPIQYNKDGTWTAFGMPSSMFASGPLAAIVDQLTLTPTQVERDIAAGIKDIELRMNDNGLAITWNGTQLPALDWSGGKLAAVIDLLKSSGMLSNLPGVDPAMVQGLLDTYLPYLTSSDIGIRFLFPTE